MLSKSFIKNKKSTIMWLTLRMISFTAICMGQLSSCKSSRSSSDIKSFSFARDYAASASQGIIIDQRLIESPLACRQNLVNLYSNAAADGTLINSALSGLGTDYPLGKKLKTDSLYFQILRIFSVFDWQITNKLTKKTQNTCLPAALGFSVGVFDPAFLKSLPQPYPKEEEKFKKSFETIFSESANFQVVSTDLSASSESWLVESGLSPSHRLAILKGALAKIKYINTASTQDNSPRDKLKALAASLRPVYLGFISKFQSTQLNQGQVYSEVYFPGFSELKIGNIDDIKSWQLVPGIALRELPKQVDVNVAKLTHIGYLKGERSVEPPLVKVQLSKDFNKPDKIKMRISFGSLDSAAGDKGSLPINVKDYKNALYIAFYPNLSPADDDSSSFRLVKKTFNAVANQLKIEARIHQLNLEFDRPSNSDPLRSGYDSLLLRPHFILRDSEISFRLTINSNSDQEAKAMTMAGFSCMPTASAEQQNTCFQDFGAFTGLNDYILGSDNGPANGSLRTFLADKIKDALNLMIKHNAKMLINWNISAIEKALDQQFEAIFTQLIDRQLETHKLISERLESVIFNTK